MRFTTNCPKKKKKKKKAYISFFTQVNSRHLRITKEWGKDSKNSAVDYNALLNRTWVTFPNVTYC
jgi:hypothetical protein